MRWGRFILLIAVIALVIFLKNPKPRAFKGVSNVIDKNINFVLQEATKSAEIVTNFVVENTVKSITNQVEKLPQKQQEEIKQNLCK